MLSFDMTQFKKHYDLLSVALIEVINHTKKHFTVDVNGRQEVVSMDHLQQDYLDIQPPQPSLTSDNQSKSLPPKLPEHSTDKHSVPSSKSPTTTINPVPTVTTTCSGHRIHWAQHLNFLLFTSFTVGEYCSNPILITTIHCHYFSRLCLILKKWITSAMTCILELVVSKMFLVGLGS